jgi:hypothetical protein
MGFHGAGSSVHGGPHRQFNPDPMTYDHDDQSDEVQSPYSRDEDGPTESSPASTSLR